MTPEPVYVTPQGMTKLQEEFDDLRNRRRAEVGRKLHAARDLEVTGDALVDDAVEEQAKIEGRILEIETILKNAKVVRHDRPTRRAAIGSTVTVQHEDGAEETYTIVGHLEADPRAGRISTKARSARRCSASDPARPPRSRPPPAPLRSRCSRSPDRRSRPYPCSPSN